MALVAILGLVLAVVGALSALALLVHGWLTRSPRAVGHVSLSVLCYNLWLAAWFLFECLRLWVLTQMEPVTALRLVAFLLLNASLLSIGWLYAWIAATDEALPSRPGRIARRLALVGGLGTAALLVVGWSAYHFNSDGVLFILLRRVIGLTVYPVALVVAIQMQRKAPLMQHAEWRRALGMLARFYVPLFAVLFVFALFRDRLGAISPILPLALDATLDIVYTTFTVLWVVRLDAHALVRDPHDARTAAPSA
ncbi:MAG TPA: hypothetical protein VGK32_18125 [Vicinamibacterales bacterium]